MQETGNAMISRSFKRRYRPIMLLLIWSQLATGCIFTDLKNEIDEEYISYSIEGQVEIQSMDDSVGVVRPDDPSLYTMRLNADGTVHMRLNCNRANGSWTAEPSADPSNGRFRFGLLSTTKAFCPPPSLDEKIAADAKYVRSYLIRENLLYLSLFADGGIYAWEPENGEHFSNEPDAAIEGAILRAFPGYTKAIVDIGGASDRARFIYNIVDLNGDGNQEALVYLLGSFFCGPGGCDLSLFSHGKQGYTLVNNFPISRPPVIISPQKTNGWNNLIRPESGGGALPSYVVYAFDGKPFLYNYRQRRHSSHQSTCSYPVFALFL